MEMANSLEGRTPFLGHHLTEFANGLPPSTKVRFDSERGTLVEKWILREAGRPYITDEMYYRRKHVSARRKLCTIRTLHADAP